MSDGLPVLVFGGTGQVGQALARQTRPHPVVALGRSDVELTDAASIDSILDQHHPALAFNAAVFQPVDLCETELREAFAVNAAAAGSLAASCGRREVRLIHLSTDYVFDGSQRQRYTEDDCPRPLNVYGRSKVAGENLVLAADQRHCVVRTSSVYGPALPDRGTASFVPRMLQRAWNGEPTRVVDDQVVSPTYAEDLARGLWELADTDAAGLFHMAGRSEASWYDIAERVFAAVDRLDLLTPTTSAEFAAPARRPPYTALTTVRLPDLGIEPPAGIADGLERHLRSAHPELFS